MPKAIRQIRVDGNIAYVPLTKGYEATIAASDVGLVCDANWTAAEDGRTVYAYRMTRLPNGKQRMEYMHRRILSPKDGEKVDHRDGDGLNNMRINLRASNCGQNARNRRLPANSTSGKKGVTFNQQLQKWKAKIVLNGKAYHLGYFPDIDSAHAAYRAASITMHGKFGRS
jgi:hypothetical protein